MKKYELVLFDADETLFDFKKAEGFALAEALRGYGIALDDRISKKYDEINKALWKRLEKGELRLDALKIERFTLLFEGLGTGIDAEAFSGSFIGWLGQGTFLLRGAEDICEYLYDKYALVIVTNGIKDVQMPRFANSRINRYIRRIIVSEDAGSSKPDIGIFDYMSRETGFADKDAMIIVGDSLSSDIQGGLNYGIDTCWFNPERKANDTGIVPKYEISGLDELRGILR